MSRVQHSAISGSGGAADRIRRAEQPPLREFMRRPIESAHDPGHVHQNVGKTERLVSLAAGSILAAMGLGRRDVTGLVIAGVGGALAYRGGSGHCPAYSALGIDTTDGVAAPRQVDQDNSAVHVSASYLINKSPEELYRYWRNFENLPTFMSHLESVRKIDERQSHWVAKAPWMYGGQVEWDAEITADEPNERIRWSALEGSDVEHWGSIKFAKALGDRGTHVRADIHYHPPAGRVGHWVAKLFGEEPSLQIHDDLRRFKRLMEVGEIPTTVGQSRGTCAGSR